MRKATIDRKTNEVSITVSLNVDGKGETYTDTTIPELDYLIKNFAFWGLFDLAIKAEGDLQHHISEDTGIVLGEAFKSALGNKAGIKRLACFTVAVNGAAVKVALDISGRPSFTGNMQFPDYAANFMEAFAQHSGMSIFYHVTEVRQKSHYRLLEAFFRALGKAMDEATTIDPRRKDIPSTKGVID